MMNLAPREKAAISVLGAVIFLALCYYFIWQGQIDRLGELRAERSEIVDEIEQKEQTRERLEKKEDEIYELERDIRLIRNQLFSERKDISPFLTVAQGIEAYADVTGVNPGSAVEREEYHLLPVEVEIEGMYSQVMRGIDYVEGLGKAASVQEISISADDNRIIQTQLNMYLFQKAPDDDEYYEVTEPSDAVKVTPFDAPAFIRQYDSDNNGYAHEEERDAKIYTNDNGAKVYEDREEGEDYKEREEVGEDVILK